MEIYKLPIELAFITFPFVAFILTIPFLIYQYRRYGAIPILKSTIFYSLILYLITAYFLVILPLPSIESVSKITSPKFQLTLFKFIEDIKLLINHNINNFGSIMSLFKQPAIYTIVFNLFLTLPWGVYLRYFFKKKWYHTLLYSFIISLFFEITQLSGLYGIYPRAYRLFDVDDLLINSIGGLIGHTIAPIFMNFLPKIEDIEKISYEKGKKVTILRRIVAFVIDIFFVLIFSLLIKLIIYDTTISKGSYLITITIYYLILPIIFPGQTFGKMVVNLKVVSSDNKNTWYKIIFRNFILVYFTIYPITWISLLSDYINQDIIKRLSVTILIYQVINIGYYIKNMNKEDKLFIYEIITYTKNISTIETTTKNTKKQPIINLKNKYKTCYNEINKSWR